MKGTSAFFVLRRQRAPVSDVPATEAAGGKDLREPAQVEDGQHCLSSAFGVHLLERLVHQVHTQALRVLTRREG